MDIQHARAAILVEQQYQEMEVWYPAYRLREAGCRVDFVGPEKGKTYPSKLGYPAVSDIAAAEAGPAAYDLIVIPGGFAPDFIRRSEAMLKFTRALVERGAILAAICHGPWVLCSTPALRGKQCTCFMAIKDDVINAGGKYTDAEVIRDGNLITSRKPEDLPAFMKTIFAVIAERKK
ncbi:MAG: type 1 glutamine amidotransferase domain-containing protein [Gemmataceae bacterium]